MFLDGHETKTFALHKNFLDIQQTLKGIVHSELSVIILIQTCMTFSSMECESRYFTHSAYLLPCWQMLFTLTPPTNIVPD